MLNAVISYRRFLTLCAFFGTLAIALCPNAGAPTPQAQHGLSGNYYLGRGWQTDAPPPAGAFIQVWTDPNDFWLPKPITAPAATRVDSQIAFGQGKAFHVGASGPQLVWWPTGFAIPEGWTQMYTDKPWDVRHFAAVIWKGYIHLPKAGTYYFGTVSNGGAAVYLNQARVALNMGAANLAPNDFSYASEQVQDFVMQGTTGVERPYLNDTKSHYEVPVPVDGPRDLPIEVDYNDQAAPSGWGNIALGIDLFWVTPDSPRDASGKPIAHIVPSEVLYTEAPGPIEKPVVRSANSTLSADFLYFYVPSDKFVTLTIRLADKDGNPVAGKRVYLNSLTTNQPDPIIQPEKPTDADGITTAKVRADVAIQHDSSFFATDVTDFVDVTQVAHVSFLPYVASFFPQGFSPYYDKDFTVAPLPMQVGKPLTITVPLENGGKYPGEVDVTFKRNDWNIGVPVWNDVIGEVKNVRLNPHEHRDISITWTPKKESGHQCFRVELQGHWIVSGLASVHPLVASVLPALAWQAGGSKNVPYNDNKQKNAGEVKRPSCGVPQWGNKQFPPNIPIHPAPCKPYDIEKNWCALQVERMQGDVDAAWEGYIDCITAHDDACAKFFIDVYITLKARQEVLQNCADDPPDASYQRLAVATSDTQSAYMEAVTKSWERYQGAEAEGDSLWMARHLTAQNSYFKRYLQALRSAAETLQKQAESLPPDDAGTLAKIQAARDQFFDRWRQGQRFTPDQLNLLKQAGVSEQQATAAVEAILAQKEIPPVKSFRATLLQIAAQDRQSANEAEQIADSPVNTGEEGKPGQPLMQTYTVANPHDTQETVDLFIRPISIPPDWKLSIVNAEEVQTTQQANNPVIQPKYPVHEIDPGKHYNIWLPAKTGTKVASVVIPVGEVGAHTTARWAVEGKIGDELIGGMVHEMNVPYIIAALQLPPVGSKEVEEELPAPGRGWLRLMAELAAAVIAVGLLAFFFLFWRRRRQTGDSATP